MNNSKLLPLITTDKLQEVKAFYLDNLDFTLSFDSEIYVGLKDAVNAQIEIGFMSPNGDEPVCDGKGLMLGLEVEEVDAEYARLREKGIGIQTPIRDNPWGDRSFIVQDPAGLRLYIHSPIPPAEEFKAYIKP